MFSFTTVQDSIWQPLLWMGYGILFTLASLIIVGWILHKPLLESISKKIKKTSITPQSDFFSILSHELRTPMHGVLGALHLMNKESLKEEQSTCLKQATTSAKSMMCIITELLDYSAVQAKEIKAQDTAVDLKATLLNLFRRVEVKCQSKKLKFNVNLSDTVPHYAILDIKKTMTILEHLLDNALKYTQEGSVDCSVNFSEKQKLIIHVIDTGVGIAYQDRKDIFKPFKQLASYAERNVNGLGLGLSICHEFVNILQGKLKYIESPTKGSHFMLSLPIKIGYQGDIFQLEHSQFDNFFEEKIQKIDENSEALDLSPKRVDKTRENIKILIVDDNATNCFVARGLVKKLGFQSETAFNGQIALNLLQEKEFDLVLMDCQMPVMDGFQATAQLRKMQNHNSEIPVIAVTANTSPKDKAMCLEHGMNEYITKPMNLHLLEERICYWLSLSREQKQKEEKLEDKNVVDWSKYKK